MIMEEVEVMANSRAQVIGVIALCIIMLLSAVAKAGPPTDNKSLPSTKHGADQTVIESIADAHVIEGFPISNYGDIDCMRAGYDELVGVSEDKTARSLVFFELSKIPSGAAINSATLRLRLVESQGASVRRTVTTYRVSADWSEIMVTWDSAPAHQEAYGDTHILHGDWDWHEFDVTDLVKAWLDGTYPNYGIMIRGPETTGWDAAWRGFSTREGLYPPQLVVDYYVPTPVPVGRINLPLIMS